MSEQASLEASLTKGTDDTWMVHLRAVPPTISPRIPGDIVVVVDVSGSMQQEAKLQAASGTEAGAPNLSVLDIVKHAVKTVMHAMATTDRLGIVAYSDKATIALPMTHMNEAGLQTAEAALMKLRADGQTNLWDGLKSGLDMLDRAQRAGATSAILLLTDGVPNVEPAGGHISAVRSYCAQRGGKLPATLHTFGFGYDLDSKLLDDLANEGGGLYVFIPDAGFVGTALVNCTANALTSFGRNVELCLEPAAGVSVQQVLGYTISEGPSGHSIVSLSALQLGQSKDVLVRIAAQGAPTELLKARLSYDGPNGRVPIEVSVDASCAAGNVQELHLQTCRLKLAEVVHQALQLPGELPMARGPIAALLEEIRTGGEYDRLKGLREDVTGQLSEAFSRADWYQSWGRHYLRSLARAHLTQQCSNFKDPGVQLYGGRAFEEVRDRADDIFLSLPAPTPEDNSGFDMLMAMGFDEDRVRRALVAANNDPELAAQYCMDVIPTRPVAAATRPAAQRAAPAAAPAAVAINMAAYHNPYGGCFAGESQVLMSDGQKLPLRELSPGDRVATSSGMAEVLCLVEIRSDLQEALLVELPGGLKITPWHPVLYHDAWRFPAELGEVRTVPCAAVYNLVLSEGHVLKVDDTWAVSLGHGLVGDVVGHEYWGSRRVIEDLQRQKGWASGKVVLNALCILRDSFGQAAGMEHEQQ